MDEVPTIGDELLSPLVKRVHGEVLTPRDEGYDDARAIWNSRLQREPAVVVRCADADDVIAAVELARDQGLPLAVRGGGHDYAGRSSCDGSVLVDLSPMNRVEIDPEGMIARVQAGATWGDFDREAQAFELGTTAGTVSTVGVAGFTLGGGTGYLARTHGLATDNLLGAEIVTVAGELVRASETENPDLFWGIRGGGGNFGIATSFEFALHPLGPQVLAGQIVYRFDDAVEVLRAYREFMEDAPDQLTCYPFIIRVPAIPAFAEEHHGKVAIDLVVAYTGEISDGERVVAPLRTIADPIMDWVEPQDWTAVQQTFDAGVPKGLRWYSKAHYLSALSDAAIDTFLEHAEPLPGGSSMVYIESLGGAIGRVAPDATAFADRQSKFGFHVLAGWANPEEDEALMGWTRSFHEAMAPYSTGGAYVNLLGEDEADRVPAVYGDNYERLVALKNTWDPENLFRMNNNIVPTV